MSETRKTDEEIRERLTVLYERIKTQPLNPRVQRWADEIVVLEWVLGE